MRSQLIQKIKENLVVRLTGETPPDKEADGFIAKIEEKNLKVREKLGRF